MRHSKRTLKSKLLTLLFAVSVLFWPKALYSEAFAPLFYSFDGREHQVAFDHIYETDLVDIRDVEKMTNVDRTRFTQNNITPLMKFLFGPNTHRSVGNPQRKEKLEVQWDAARLEAGKVILPFKYSGVWILERTLASAGYFETPVPYNFDKLFTPQWKRCTDSSPSHQSPSIFWYYWDPHRYGCDHKEGIHYKTVTVQVGAPTVNEERSYPEYSRMMREDAGGQKLSLTVAFGYVEDPMDPRPDFDSDAGAYEYRKFVKLIKGRYSELSEDSILLSEYQTVPSSDKIIGRRFRGLREGVRVELKVVMSAGVDQMYLFAKSFSHDHDGFFAWMGHSRVGSGFDADNFQYIIRSRPQYYSITRDYQVVYWGGCNSYSYYTLPFFDIKARASGGTDPLGTLGLDIIAHGLPSYFSMNAINALVVTDAVMNWSRRPSYQQIIQGLERNADVFGITLLAAALGDEDNPK